MATTEEVFKHYREGVDHERKRCLKAVKAEPELPGDMPPEMAQAVADAIKNEDADFFIEAMRLAVRMTKDGIYERIVSG